jgi:hypothetical protein
MLKKTNIFLYYILIGIAMLLSAFIAHKFLWDRALIFMIIMFFSIGLVEQFEELKGFKQNKLNLVNLEIIIGAFLAAALTWYINHNLGIGPIIANGIIGVVVALVFPSKLAGAYYVASFVGMSAQSIMPSMIFAGVGGVLAGIIIVLSEEAYNGIGGKGGTTAAFSTQIVSTIMGLFI